jgi:hypothetical protein
MTKIEWLSVFTLDLFATEIYDWLSYERAESSTLMHRALDMYPSRHSVMSPRACMKWHDGSQVQHTPHLLRRAKDPHSSRLCNSSMDLEDSNLPHIRGGVLNHLRTKM